METQIRKLDVLIGKANFWSDGERARRVTKEAADLKNEFDGWQTFRKNVGDLLSIAQLAAEENDSSLHDDLLIRLEALEKEFEKREFVMLLCGPFDAENAVVSIHAGSGGTEAQDWTQMLLRMYLRFAQGKAWEVDVLAESRAEDVGLKSVTIRVRGRYAYGYLRSEAGVHRLVRISPFDAEKMRHTTFALVEVIPELKRFQN